MHQFSNIRRRRSKLSHLLFDELVSKLFVMFTQRLSDFVFEVIEFLLNLCAKLMGVSMFEGRESEGANSV